MDNRTRILVVEDDPDYQKHYSSWLSTEKFLVKMSRNLEETALMLDSHYFDIAIVDMNLENDKDGGMKVLSKIREMGDPTRVIIISADVSKENVRNTYEKFGASVLFKTELSRDRLVDLINQELSLPLGNPYEKISLYNFFLKERGLSDQKIFLVSNNKPDIERLLQNLFLEILPLNNKLNITSNLVEVSTEEYMLQISGWSRGVGSTVVVRLGSRKRIEKESHAYNKHIQDLVESFGSVKMGPFYHKTLGGIIYVLSNTQIENLPLTDFNHFYQKEDTMRVVEALKKIFRVIENLYQSRKIDKVAIDISLTNKALFGQLTRYKKQETNNKDTYAFNSIDEKVNPLDFLLNHKFVFDNIPVGVVHGELTAGNILINSEMQMWLLGFYFTGSESDVIVPTPAKSDNIALRARQAGKRNLLHDYVTLEVSIRRQLTDLSLKEIIEFDQSLCKPRTLSEMTSFQVDFNNPNLNKAYHVITSLRKQVSEFVKFDNDLKVYYSELLFQLIEIYFYPRNEIEKRNVYLSASVLADKLKKEHLS